MSNQPELWQLFDKEYQNDQLAELIADKVVTKLKEEGVVNE